MSNLDEHLRRDSAKFASRLRRREAARREIAVYPSANIRKALSRLRRRWHATDPRERPRQPTEMATVDEALIIAVHVRREDEPALQLWLRRPAVAHRQRLRRLLRDLAFLVVRDRDSLRGILLEALR